jgi:hypothetical protein
MISHRISLNRWRKNHSNELLKQNNPPWLILKDSAGKIIGVIASDAILINFTASPVIVIAVSAAGIPFMIFQVGGSINAGSVLEIG